MADLLASVYSSLVSKNNLASDFRHRDAGNRALNRSQETCPVHFCVTWP